jgi:NAD(P)-dependent dehydrogenase (short-subunit alcohol dehydrogenase family)
MSCGALASGNVLVGRGGGIPGSRIRRGRVPEVPALKIRPVISGQILSASRSGSGSGHFGGPVKIIRHHPGRRMPQLRQNFLLFGSPVLAQVMFSFDLAAELDQTGMTVSALHPATFMPTKVSPAPPISRRAWRPPCG